MHHPSPLKRSPDVARRRALLATASVMGGALFGAGCEANTSVPDLPYTLLNGESNSTAALKGQVVWVNFWATHCGPCVAEVPKWISTHQRYGASGLTTLAVAMSYDPPALVSRFAQERQLPFGVVIDNTGAFARGFGGVQQTPTSFLLDKRGLLAKRWVGAVSTTQLHALIDQLLAQPA